jgi:LPS-assembly lipoprotein
MRGVLALLGLIVLVLPGCGFRPLYGGGPGGVRQTELAAVAIRITPIDTQLGAELRNNLIDRLTPGGEPINPRYRLTIALREQKTGVGIQPDASISRWNYTLTASYRLTDIETGKPLHKGTTQSITAYNVADSQFATLSAAKDAERRAAIDVSNEIETALALYFAKPKADP